MLLYLSCLDSETNSAVFCFHAPCVLLVLSRQHTARTRGAPLFKRVPMKVKLVCKECGKEYFRYPYHAKGSHFCSNTCRARQSSRNFTHDLIGQRFGRLLVIERSPINGKDGETRWLCKCDCGNTSVVYKQSLVSGQTQSCGCLHLEVSAEHARKHFTKNGQSKNPNYDGWRARLRREADSEWTIEMDALLFQLQPACVICGSTKKLCVDHVSPFSKGNGLKPGNAVVLCMSCNSWKHDKDLSQLPQEWQDKILRAASQFLDTWNSL